MEVVISISLPDHWMRLAVREPFHPLPPDVLCPACGDRMRVTMIAPLTLERDADEMTFRCYECEIELKRVTRRDGVTAFSGRAASSNRRSPSNPVSAALFAPITQRNAYFDGPRV
jgi:hypothetical protein